MAQDVTVSAVWKNILVTQPAQSETVFYCQAETQTVFFCPRANSDSDWFVCGTREDFLGWHEKSAGVAKSKPFLYYT